jgi:4-hydroxyphenylpyruvate dioxygenase
MQSTQQVSLGIVRLDSLHFFVRELDRSRFHYQSRLGFQEIAVSGRKFEDIQGMQASMLVAGDARFLFMKSTREGSDASRFLAAHPEGVGRIVFQVEDAEFACQLLMEREATLVTPLIECETDAGGFVRYFDIATPFGSTTFRFIEYCAGASLEAGLVPLTTFRANNRFNIGTIDHVTSNFLTLKPVTMWFEQVMGFERYWGIEFHTQDVNDKQDGGSGLRSIVMWDPRSGLKFANNEPAAPHFHASQIYRFCEDHGGAGVQHVALTVRDIVTAVRGMNAAGGMFMDTPSAYYRRLPHRMNDAGITLEENIETLKQCGILVDGGEKESYLLQIFMKEAAAQFADLEGGPLFIELIERKGDQGFGAGNFRALFESIEAGQRDSLPPGSRDSIVPGQRASFVPPMRSSMMPVPRDSFVSPSRDSFVA